jgi:hypothetical protein
MERIDELIDRKRAIFRRYQEHFGVPDEVA